MNFASDNGSGASAKIINALIAANTGASPAYGADNHSANAQKMLAGIFERDLAAFLVPTGTASNALALAALCPPWGGVFCHREAHVMEDECGAPEFFTGGAKLIGIPGAHGKITPQALAQTLTRFPAGLAKQVQPAALSLSQATECGTVYSCTEIGALTKTAHEAGLKTHMDGARFANALLCLGCTPAEMTWKAGIDVLSFGGTKNGAIACEAVIFFDPALAENFAYQRKRGGHTLSKGRFLGAQMEAYLGEDHWLDLARHANGCAAQFSKALAALPGVRLAFPTQANEIFVILPKPAEAALKAAGALYYNWTCRSHGPGEGARENEAFLRLVTSFATTQNEIDAFLAIVRAAL